MRPSAHPEERPSGQVSPPDESPVCRHSQEVSSIIVNMSGECDTPLTMTPAIGGTTGVDSSVTGACRRPHDRARCRCSHRSPRVDRPSLDGHRANRDLPDRAHIPIRHP